MLTLNLSAEIEALLQQMAHETGRTPEDIARRALLDAVEDYEDAKLADERLRTSDGTSVGWDEVKARLLGHANAK